VELNAAGPDYVTARNVHHTIDLGRVHMELGLSRRDGFLEEECGNMLINPALMPIRTDMPVNTFVQYRQSVSSGLISTSAG
jgi:hypothetical protein